MKFIFLAAGKGSRIYKKIKINKCLIKIKKKTLIEELIENIPKKYEKDISVITGFKSDLIIKKLKKYKINFIRNKNYKTTEMLYSLYLGLTKFNDDILFSYTDVIYDRSLIKKIIRKKTFNINVPINLNWKKIWDIREKDILDDAETLKYKNKKLLEIGNKINNINDVMGQFMGLIFIPKKKRSKIINILKSNKFKNKHLTFFINYLIKRKFIINVTKYKNFWYEFDDNLDLKNFRKIQK